MPAGLVATDWTVSLHAPLVRAAAGKDVRLVLGWMPGRAPDLDPAAFTDVRVVMGGPGVRGMVESAAAQFVPCRLSAVPALLSGPLRPDLLGATLVRGPDGLHLGAEVGYLRGLIDLGVPVAATVSRSTPLAEVGPPIPPEQVTIVGETSDPPIDIPDAGLTEVDEAIARHVAALVP